MDLIYYWAGFVLVWLIIGAAAVIAAVYVAGFVYHRLFLRNRDFLRYYLTTTSHPTDELRYAFTLIPKGNRLYKFLLLFRRRNIKKARKTNV